MSLAIGGVDLSAASAKVAQGLAQSQSVAKPATAASATTTGAASATGTGISSSDFLTLLVTEMKNQDPTQPTDPNAYIQQLVGVNSLQQLISINQDLSSVAGSGTTPSGGVTSTSGI